MKVLLTGIAVNTAIMQALLETRFEVVQSENQANKKASAHPNNDEFRREFKQRQKAELRKAMKKPARGGGRP